jgi:very-short-patch-repair endonuclease
LGADGYKVLRFKDEEIWLEEKHVIAAIKEAMKKHAKQD